MKKSIYLLLTVPLFILFSCSNSDNSLNSLNEAKVPEINGNWNFVFSYKKDNCTIDTIIGKNYFAYFMMPLNGICNIKHNFQENQNGKDHWFISIDNWRYGLPNEPNKIQFSGTWFSDTLSSKTDLNCFNNYFCSNCTYKNIKFQFFEPNKLRGFFYSSLELDNGTIITDSISFTATKE